MKIHTKIYVRKSTTSLKSINRHRFMMIIARKLLLGSHLRGRKKASENCFFVPASIDIYVRIVCVCTIWTVYEFMIFTNFFSPFLLNNTAIMLTFLRALNAIISQICARARIFQIFMENGVRAAVKIFCMCIVSKDITRIRKWKPRGRSLSRAYILSFLSRGSF